MEYKDYYSILGVPREADNAAIKRAFRNLARQLHPDVNPGNSEAERLFKEVNEAYNVLGDGEKRNLYDRLGSQWSHAQRAGGFDWTSYFDSQDINDDQGQDSGYRTSSRWDDPPSDDLGSDSAFSSFFQQMFKDAPRTESKTSRRPRVKVYETSTGGPGGPGYQHNTGNMGGEQKLPVVISLEEAFWGATRTVQQGGARFDVAIPQGVRDGSRVRVSTHVGELLLEINIKAHPIFTPDEANLRTTKSVDLYCALLGGEIHVPTLEGTLALMIPANTQNGRVFRLKGQGMPINHNPAERGDLLVDIAVELPVPLTAEEQRRFTELRRMRPPYR